MINCTYLLLLLGIPAVPLAVDAAGIPVLSDTNQIKLFPGLKVDWTTNLAVVQTVTEVTTNWVMVGPPQDLKDTNGIVIARRLYQSSNLLTNVYHFIEYEGQEHRLSVSRTTGPLMENRFYDIPPMLTDSKVSLPARIPPKER